MPHILLLALLSMPILTAHAAQYSSGDQRVIAVELFTSQGCSSCPPADRRLSRLKDHPLLWKRFVPMAWHVDYWDYLGWRDPYADSANSRRQTDYRRAGATKVVYTPGFFRDGKEWRSWYGEPVADEEKNALGRLTLNVEGGTATLQLDTPVDMQAKGLLGHIAILGFDLATPVERGENRGEMLHEDFRCCSTVAGMEMERAGRSTSTRLTCRAGNTLSSAGCPAAAIRVLFKRLGAGGSRISRCGGPSLSHEYVKCSETQSVSAVCAMGCTMFGCSTTSTRYKKKPPNGSMNST